MDDEKQARRTVYITPRQKKKLIELVSQHPEVISCKVTPGFTYKDSQLIWKKIAAECNALLGPGAGAQKSWRQWRKTWQDLRSNVRKRHAESNGDLPLSMTKLTPAEQEALGLKNVSSTTSCQESTEFVMLEQENSFDFNNECESPISFSEPESPQEKKVFDLPKERKKIKSKTKLSVHDSNKCNFNCDNLAACEEKKLQIKEDYFNFKKEYLKQKLEIMRQQTEALQNIARELSKVDILKSLPTIVQNNT
ncbi:uncharacterized protein LOC128675547 [Plodia interpunctella]|uniref:uncharacterized protein LOC128675547 n=1 Tax=Plodia interpunctella TaxID=58824 RepID=UPI002368B39A|nr:uncharacterized protein LOC128675547 [Plodia interpunctella]